MDEGQFVLRPQLLRCWIYRDDLDAIFHVEIPNTDSVLALKEAIKHKNPLPFHDLDSKYLTLYSTDVPDKQLSGWTPRGKPVLTSLRELSVQSFIVVDNPGPDFACRFPVHYPPLHAIGRHRREFLRSNKPVASSSHVALLHIAFTQFLDDCEASQITAADYALATELRLSVASKYMSGEIPSPATVRSIFSRHGLYFDSDVSVTKVLSPPGPVFLESSSWQFYLSVYDHQYAILEIINDNTMADSYRQACSFYEQSTKRFAETMEMSCLPCITMLFNETWVDFAGAAWNLGPVVEILSSVDMDYPVTDNDTPTIRVARHLAAFRKAINTLEHYYRNIYRVATQPEVSQTQAQLFPYPTHFHSLQDGSLQHIEYTSQPFEDKPIFYGSLLNERVICVKFVKEYSKEAHEACVSLGCAPVLVGLETMPGGLFMVVMDALDPKEYVPFLEGTSTTRHIQMIRGNLEQLHELGYVHGDVREVNIMLSKTNPERTMILDFDFAGEIGKVRYPMDVYKGWGLWRPERVVGGELILAEDDMAMLDHIEKYAFKSDHRVQLS